MQVPHRYPISHIHFFWGYFPPQKEQRNLGAILSYWPSRRRNLAGDYDALADYLINRNGIERNYDENDIDADHHDGRNLQEQQLVLNFRNVIFEVSNKPRYDFVFSFQFFSATNMLYCDDFAIFLRITGWYLQL